jgi:hypothetical protein
MKKAMTASLTGIGPCVVARFNAGEKNGNDD